MVDAKIGNGDLDRSHLRAEDLPAARIDRQAGALELHVGIDAGHGGPAVGVVERGVRDLEGDEELAAPGIGEGEVGEVARKRHAHVARPAVPDGGLQPVAHARVERERQIAIEVLRIGACKLRAQVDHPGSLRLRAPAAARRSRGVRRGEFHVLENHAHLVGGA